MKYLSYATMTMILDSWEHIRRTPNFREEVGVAILKKLVAQEPKWKARFGPSQCSDPLGSKKFLAHGRLLGKMLDSAVDMLGPDTDGLTSILRELGARHYHNYGVFAGDYEVMGKCVLAVLKETLKNEFAKDVEQAWDDMWKEMSKDMISGENRYKMFHEDLENLL